MSDELPPDDSQPARKRRVRYKGTHPRSFKEKYKEHGGDSQTAEKIIAKGGTPAGTHRPILVQEILEVLEIKSSSTIVDLTLGYGGHSSEFLERLDSSGRLVAFDRDPRERPKTESRLREKYPNAKLDIVADNYSTLEKEIEKRGLTGKVDALLADLGLSSMQIDDPDRGFTFKREGPLDLRMNPDVGVPASDILKTVSAQELEHWLRDYCDEPRAKWCAEAILKRQKRKPIETTADLADSIRDWIKTLSPQTREKEGDTPIRRAFQALRIVVNDEFTSLDRMLASLPRVMKSGGRIAIMSFHSGEDRRVKKAFQAGLKSGEYSEISPDLIRPSIEEIVSNSRSKSAKLRWARRS